MKIHDIIGLTGTWLLANVGLLQTHDASASGLIALVGQDSTCQYRTDQGDTIQDAIDDGFRNIRIVSGTYQEALVLAERNQVISGGFANCLDALNNIPDGNRVGINSTGLSQRPITIDFEKTISGSVLNFDLNNLFLFGGSPGSVSSGGGLLVAGNFMNINLNNVVIDGNSTGSNGGGLFVDGSDISLVIENSRIEDNSAALFGGGVFLEGEDIDVSLTDVLIEDNSAISGGGLFCTGSNTVLMESVRRTRGGLINNQATGADGGGALISEGCELTSHLGMLVDLSRSNHPAKSADFLTQGSPDIGIIANQAVGNGGGVAVFDRAVLRLNGQHPNCELTACMPASVLANVADSNTNGLGDGGGVFASGTNAFVDMQAVDISLNQAINGGAIALTEFASGNLNREVDQPCWSEYHCNRVSSNIAENQGGAQWVENASLNSQFVHYTKNTANTGVVAHISGGTGGSFFSTVLMHDNGFSENNPDLLNAFLIQVDTLGERTGVHFSTLADNDIAENISESIADRGTQASIINSVSGGINITNSIIHDANEVRAVYSGNPNAAEFNCVMVHDATSLPPDSSSQISVADPMFVNRRAGDYHLDGSASPAIDFCDADTRGTPLPLLDIDLELRGLDNPQIPNQGGLFDLGFDESNSDIIFVDGFESN